MDPKSILSDCVKKCRHAYLAPLLGTLKPTDDINKYQQRGGVFRLSCLRGDAGDEVGRALHVSKTNPLIKPSCT